MAEMQNDASKVQKIANQGQFFIDKKTAAACFKYSLPAVPAPAFPNLRISLEYSSESIGEDFLQTGWHLAGFEGIRKAANGDYFLRDHQIFPAAASPTKIVTYDHEGIKRRFQKLAHSREGYFHLTAMQDAYGNMCQLRYDAQNRLSNLIYDDGGTCRRQVSCEYCPRSGKLLHVRSLLDDDICFDTEIKYEKDHLAQINSYAFEDEWSDPTASAEFQHDPQTRLLCWLKHRPDAEIKVFYADNSTVVSSYHEFIQSFRGQDKKLIFDVIATGLTEAFDRPSFYEVVTIWSPSSRIGTTWRHSVEPETLGFVIAEEFGCKRDKSGHIVPRRSSNFQYACPASNCLPKICQITTVDIPPSGKVSQSDEVFEYDRHGNMCSASDGKTLTQKEYIRGPAPFYITLLKSAILYDVSNSRALKDTQILKAEYFAYEFSPETGALLVQHHQRAMTSNTNTNPVISKYDARGRLHQLIDEKGATYGYAYDRLGFIAEVTYSAADGQNSLKDRFKYCPRSGEILKQQHWRSATKFYDRDAFGAVRAEYQQIKGADQICLLNRQIRWHNECSVFVEVLQAPTGNDRALCNMLNLYDGVGRPRATALEIAPDIWEVVLQSHDTVKKMTARTLPFCISASVVQLIGKIQKRKTKLYWERTYFDDLGRVSLIKQADGSKLIHQYFKRNDGTTIEEVTSIDPAGRKEKRDRREINANGEVRYKKSTDTQETVQKLDILGRVIRESTGASDHVEYEYDLLGNCVAEIHSKFGQTRQIIGPDLQIHLQQKKDQTIYYERDWLGRVVRTKTENANNETIEYQTRYEFDPTTHTHFEPFTSDQGVCIRTELSPFGDEIPKQVSLDEQFFRTANRNH